MRAYSQALNCMTVELYDSSYMLGISEQINQQVKQDHWSSGAYILVSSGGAKTGNK